MDGSGPQFAKQEQVLNQRQSDLPLDPQQPLDLGVVDFNFDMSDLSCSDVRFMCLHLTKHEDASVNFVARPEAGLMNCMPLSCDGT